MVTLAEAIFALEEQGLSQQPQSAESLLPILQRCRNARNPHYAQRLFACIRRRGFESSRSLGMYLVPMLAEAGSLRDAQHVFDMQCDQNEGAWNALIAGYARHGEPQRALSVYRDMQKKSVSSSSHTFVPVISACAKLKDLERGQEIHAEVARKGLDVEVHVGSSLVDMYAKCSLPFRAQAVFDKLADRHVVAWNSLLAGYSMQGLGANALDCYAKMELEGIPPSPTTFVCGLKACGSVGAVEKGEDIHNQISSQGMEGELFIGSALVDMYANFGLVVKAQAAFEKMVVRDVVTWTSLIRAFAEHRRSEQAIQGYQQMQMEGIFPNSQTLVCGLKACGSITEIHKGQELHASIAEKILEENPFVGSALIDMYINLGLYCKAHEVLDSIRSQDIVTWNTMIAGYVKHDHGREALNCYGQLKAKGLSPNIATFASAIKACSITGCLDYCQGMHIDAQREGLATDLVVGSALLDMYVNCGLLAKAQEVFDKLLTRNTVSWNALISGYLKHDANVEALLCFERMQGEGIPADVVTLVYCLKACGRLGAAEKGQEIHDTATRNALSKHLILGCTLVDMYANCGILCKAQEVFHSLLVRDAASWNALLVGYAQLGEPDEVFEAFARMRGEGQTPSVASFISVLNACSHAGLVDKGHACFKFMREDPDKTPTLEHHSCLIDLLGRAGLVGESLAVIKTMPLHPNLVVWHTVLGAVRKWSNVELGMEAFKHAIELSKRDSLAYFYMFNIFSDAGMQEDAERIEAMRLENAMR